MNASTVRSLVAGLVLSGLAAQSTPVLLRDINTQPSPIGSNPLAQQANPHGTRPQDGEAFLRVGSNIVFRADDGVHGDELWFSNGTTVGTTMLDIYPGVLGSSPDGFFLWGGIGYFGAEDGVHGHELWRTDGTPAGTWMLKDLRPGPGPIDSGYPGGFAPVGGQLAFRARTLDPFLWTWTLWVTDGTAVGTYQVTSNAGQCDPQSITPVPGGSAVVFQNNNTFELWRSDGTALGTYSLSTGAGPVRIAGFQIVGSTVFFGAEIAAFTSGNELWRTNGTLAGTMLVRDLLPGPLGGCDILGSCAFAGELYFVGSDGTGRTLWRSNGTFAGTVPVLPVSFPGISVLQPVGATLYLATSQGLHTSDGTSAGTSPLAFGGPLNAHAMRWAAGKLWLNDWFSPYYDQLWVSDGTGPGTFSIGTPSGGPGSGGVRTPAYWTEIAPGVVLFAATNGLHGQELWRSNGTTAGTWMVRDIRPVTAQSLPDMFCELRPGLVCFSADDGINGRELWVSDGTTGGTTMVADAAPGPSGIQPMFLARLGRRVLFAALGPNGNALWVSDGTAGGTSIVSSTVSPSYLRRVGDYVYFQGNDGGFGGSELWRSDGTGPGTVLVADIHPTSSSQPSGFAALGSSDLFVFNAAGVGNDRELFLSNGTGPGTVLLKNINPTGSSSPDELTTIRDRVVFRAYEPGTGNELWITDGTFAGTVLLMDLEPGPGSSVPSHLSATDDGRCVFTATTSANGTEIWITDGTPAGTVRLTDLAPGAADLQPRYTTVGGNRHIWFTAEDGSNGRELWVLRDLGTGPASMVADLAPGATGSNPDPGQIASTFVDSMGRLFFTATNGVIGGEPYVVDEGAWARAYDRGCGLGATRIELRANAPVVGSTCTFAGRNAPAGSMVALILFVGVPDLTPLPPTPCLLWTTPIDIAPLWLPSPGTTWSLPIPFVPGPALAGLPFSSHAFHVGPGAVVDISNAVAGRIGF